MSGDHPPPKFLPGEHVLEGYGNGGFSFAGMSHRGSILALPSGLRAWAARLPAEIDAASLAPVFAEPPGAIEHLLVGTGVELRPLPRELREKLRAAGITGEPMASAAAARTYAILIGERRRVAAAILAVD